MSRLHLTIVVAVGFLALTALVTFPQITGFSTSVPYHRDPYFSMWRLGWVAHALLRDPRQLFETNIFFPERDTLAYSDAILLPAAAAAPFFWMGLAPIGIYNALLFAALTLSGVTAFRLARELTGDATAGVVAGVIFAFAPYRFDHYMHLEMQMVFWLPVALLLIHRLVVEPRIRDGVLLGITIAAQAFSSVYAGIFFVTYCTVFVPLLALVNRVRAPLRLMSPLLVGAALTLALVLPYSLAYSNAELIVGTRETRWLVVYSASLSHFLVAPPSNRLFGSRSPWEAEDELYLFPGFAAAALTAFGIWRGTGRSRFAYLAGLILAFDLTRGFNGLIYPWLYEYLPPFRALRSPVRSAILINLSMAVLGAYGAAWILRQIQRGPWRTAAGAAMIGVLVVEFASSPDISPAPSTPAVDHWLAQQPQTIVVQLPMTVDWLYMYQGIGHFQSMLNGYSGFEPASYHETRNVMTSFPDDRSIAYLRDRHVGYVVVRGAHYQADERAVLLAAIRRRGELSPVAYLAEAGSDDSVFALLPP